MDYQTSQSSIKSVSCLKKTSLVFLLTLTFFGSVFADTTTNPLTVDISVSALVPQTAANNPSQYPDTPPISSSPTGPVNMIDTLDVAVFRGLSYPKSTVSLLKNGSVVTESVANVDGTFEIHLRGLTQGTYTFGIRAEDTEHIQSKLLTITVYIGQGVTTLVEGIFIPPTITTNKVEVKYGEVIDFFGRSAPNADVKISINKKEEMIKVTKASSQGVWLYQLQTKELGYGEYEAKALSFNTDSTSPYGDPVTFIVGNTTRPRTNHSLLAGFRKRCDLNDDSRVNILDFSIMAFWYKRLGFPPRVDLSSDGRINLTDLSILAYCWTG
jgi:hypothetical protein